MGAGAIEHEFKGRLVMLGFGSSGQGVLPLLLRHIGMQPDQLLVITPSDAGTGVAQQCRVPCPRARLTPQNHPHVLQPPWSGRSATGRR